MAESQVTSTEFEDQPRENEPLINNIEANPKPATKLNSNFWQRTWTTIAMILAFVGFLSAGQIYSVVLVQFLSTMIFAEINSIKRNQEKEVKIPMTKFINWYFFIVFNYFQLGNFISMRLPYLGMEYQVIGSILFYHKFFSFCLFIIGFLSFVLSLKQGFLKYQFRLFGWMIISTILCSTASWAICLNIYEGLIYFIVPCFLIVINDIFAYLFGYFLGRHQLIALSPKKTWEGYIGGAISTCLFSIILTESLSQFTGLLCPVTSLDLTPFVFNTCATPILQAFVFGPFSLTKLQAHFMIMSLFASTIGPFGGFFASGLKRSIKIKDFGTSIPGHGGVSDRMDCQLIMGTFMHIYHQTFIKALVVGSSAFIISMLTPAEQLELYNSLQASLSSMNMLNN